MSYQYDRELIAQQAAKIKAEGFRVFIAERGTYGFYTDTEGTRVVGFQVDRGEINYSGNYKSEHCGTGWGMNIGSLQSMFQSHPPRWATKGEAVVLTTLEQHLKTYQASSRYEELK